MNNYPIKILVDKVTDIMEKNGCRLYDSDIVRALNKATCNIDSFNKLTVTLDCTELQKY